MTPTRKLMAEISMALFLRCHQLGLKPSVKCSHSSYSRYLIVPGAFTFRISDHDHRVPVGEVDEVIIVRPNDNPGEKLAEAFRLLERYVAEPTSAAA